MNLINTYLLSMQIITSFVNWRQPSNIRRYFFVYNGVFEIARSVRNVSGSTLSRDVKLVCNKHSDIVRNIRRFNYSIFISL